MVELIGAVIWGLKVAFDVKVCQNSCNIYNIYNQGSCTLTIWVFVFLGSYQKPIPDLNHQLVKPSKEVLSWASAHGKKAILNINDLNIKFTHGSTGCLRLWYHEEQKSMCFGLPVTFFPFLIFRTFRHICAFTIFRQWLFIAYLEGLHCQGNLFRMDLLKKNS